MTLKGELTERITFQRPVTTPDGMGGVTTEWAEVDQAWAKAVNLRGGEAMAEGRMVATTVVRFTVYSRADVLPTWQILWRGVPHNIREFPLGSSRDQFLEIIAERGVAS